MDYFYKVSNFPQKNTTLVNLCTVFFQKHTKTFGFLNKSYYLCNRFFKSTTNGDPLAQSVEHHTFNVGVLGSSPKRITKGKEFFGIPFSISLKINHLASLFQKLCFYPPKVPLLPDKTTAFTRQKHNLKKRQNIILFSIASQVHHFCYFCIFMYNL